MRPAAIRAWCPPVTDRSQVVKTVEGKTNNRTSQCSNAFGQIACESALADSADAIDADPKRVIKLAGTQPVSNIFKHDISCHSKKNISSCCWRPSPDSTATVQSARSAA